jgi:hypothetical protein
VIDLVHFEHDLISTSIFKPLTSGLKGSMIATISMIEDARIEPGTGRT